MSKKIVFTSVLLTFISTLFLTGCSIFTTPVLHIEQLPAQYPKLMVGNKCSIPVYIVVDPALVKASGTTPNEWPIEYTGLDHFVGRDIYGAMTLFFNNVKVGPPDPSLAEQKMLVVEVRIDTLTYHNETISSSQVTAQTNYAEMDWALAIRKSNSQDYLFSFATKTRGEQAFSQKKQIPSAYQNLFGSAISQFLHSYTSKKIHEKMMQL